MATQTTQTAYPPLDSQATDSLITDNVSAGDRTGDLPTDFRLALYNVLALSNGVNKYSIDDLWARYVQQKLHGNANAANTALTVNDRPRGQHPKHVMSLPFLVNPGNANGFPAGVAPSVATAEWDTTNKSSTSVLSNSNLTVTDDGAGWQSGEAHSDMIVSTGKWYWEITVDDLGSTTHQMHGFSQTGAVTYESLAPGLVTNSHGWQSNGQVYQNGGLLGTYGAYTDLDVLMFAVDMDANKIWYGKNGTWENSGDPVAGTGDLGQPAYNGLPMWGTFDVTPSDVITAEFGSNLGFTYTPPTGYTGIAYVLG